MAAESSPNADIEALSYEDAREQLVSVVGKLEAGGASLEESLALWERGEALAKRCEQWLEGARKQRAAARDQAADQDLRTFTLLLLGSKTAGSGRLHQFAFHVHVQVRNRPFEIQAFEGLQ